MSTGIRSIGALLVVGALVAGADVVEAHAMGGSASGRGMTAVSAAQAQSAPSIPFIERVAPKGLAALLSWAPNPPSDNVTGYTAQATAVSSPLPSGCSGAPAATLAPGGDTAAVVTGLCARVAYTITLTATNAAGTSTASSPSNPVVPLPAQKPTEPLITSILPRNGALLVGWSAPSDDGGSSLTGYILKATGGGSTATVKPSASSTQATVTGLTNGTTYSLTLQVSNSVGNSAAATGSGVPKPVYAPGPPRGVTVEPTTTGGDVKASWTAPLDNGGASVSSYSLTYQQVVLNANGVWVPKSGSSPTTVTGITSTSYVASSLSANVYYSFSVAAVNTVGTGSSAGASGPVTPNPQLQSNAVVLTTATLNALASDVNGTLTWPSPAPTQVTALKTGQVIVGGTAAAAPDGLLRNVMSVTSNSGAYVIGTTPARLSDALVNAGFAQSVNPSAMSGSSFRATTPGIRMTASSGISFSTTWTLDINVQQHDSSCSACVSVSFVGEIDVTPTVSVDLTLDPTNGATFQATGKVDATATASIQLQGEWQHQIGEIVGEPFVVLVGDIPIVLVPLIPVDLDVDGSISVGASVDVTVGASLSWNSKSGKLATQNLSTGPTLHAGAIPGASASGSASIGVEVGPELSIFDITGPEVSAELLLKATVNYNPSPGTPFISIGPEIDVKAGWDINILSWDAKFEVTLATLSFSAFTITAPPAYTICVTPANAFVPAGQQKTFTAARCDGQSDSFTWSLVDGVQGDSVSSSGVFTAAAPGGRSLTVVAQDPSFVQGEVTVSVGSPFDAPQNLTAILTGGGGAAVSWTAPAHTGGSAISGYTVVTQPSTTTQSLGASRTSTSISGLDPSTNYVVEVYATNTAQLQSAPATSLLQQAAAWNVVSSPDSNSAQNNTIYGVSCAGAAFCMGVGSYEPGSSQSTTLGWHWNGSRWGLSVTGNESGSVDSLEGVSCVTSSFCMAVGYYDSGSGYQTEIQQWDGSFWNVLSSPNTGAGDKLLSVSCVSTTFCMAGGYYDDSAGRHTLLQEWNGTAWSIVSSPNTTSDQNYVNGVSCASTGFCVAAGYALQTSTSNFQTLIEQWNGANWRIVSSPNTAASDELLAVSCPTSVFCAATGHDSSGPLTETWNGTSWSLASSQSVGSTDWLAGVSCVNSGFCAAAGYDSTGSATDTLIEVWNGTSWTAASSPNPSSQSNLFFGVSCASTNFCAAAGEYYSGTVDQSLIEEL